MERTITVCNIEEAKNLCHFYDHVITAGPKAYEVNWGHRSHHIEVFEDYVNETGPTIHHVERMLNFYRSNTGDVLVHCHAGVSRSTATAIGCNLVDGMTPKDAVLQVWARQPLDAYGDARPFWPNGLLINHLEVLFGVELGEVLVGLDV